MKTILLLIFLLILISCKRNVDSSANKTDNGFFEVDIEKGINSNKQLKVSLFCDSIEYIPLETRADCLIAEIKDMKVNNEFIFVLAEDSGKELFVFSRNGKFLNKIGKQGRGPKEYYDLIDYTVCGDSVFVVDYAERIALYKITGEFIRYIKLAKQASCILHLNKDLFACYIPDSFFEEDEKLYNWLVLNSKGDSVNSIQQPFLRYPSEKKLISNHYVLTDFSSEHPASFKEAFNDTLYYIDSINIESYGLLHLGLHKIDYTKSFEEIASATHNMRINRLIDTKSLLFTYYVCMCRGNNVTHRGVFDKNTYDFFNLTDEHSDEKLINDLNGPNFWPLSCNTSNQLISYVNALECTEVTDFMKKYKIKETDNPIVILASLKNK